MPSKRRWKCPRCPAAFQWPHQLDEHLASKHDTNATALAVKLAEEMAQAVKEKEVYRRLHILDLAGRTCKMLKHKHPVCNAIIKETAPQLDKIAADALRGQK